MSTSKSPSPVPPTKEEARKVAAQAPKQKAMGSANWPGKDNLPRAKAMWAVLAYLSMHGPAKRNKLKLVAPYNDDTSLYKQLDVELKWISGYKPRVESEYSITSVGRDALFGSMMQSNGDKATASAEIARILNLLEGGLEAGHPAGATSEAAGLRDHEKSEPARPATLPAEEADQSHYSPEEGDRRTIVERQIRERRGQKPFRDALRKRYGNRCMVTDCQLLDVLEAAHIKPYRGDNDHHPENGLLLRADIHTLFDLDLLGIEPDQLRIELHPDLAKHPEYTVFQGQPLRCPPNRRPSSDALRIRHWLFQTRSRSPA